MPHAQPNLHVLVHDNVVSLRALIELITMPCKLKQRQIMKYKARVCSNIKNLY